ncbi:indole-3-glycerol phosphate synthase TrpC [Halarsenatibacter silvermanii]|uniref:Indole-3-glycerol phosphate synthase n=1 Tax=Halarsenatibacter silvermanii TaxID=321763 RepID=A0A1G9J676_9FIRM|nr:indole-3-glycerol phosphate synthase TrpC [Halarsenatibacter silvermanii]SDL32664.1 indole-3-glycerol phosphate synthase [Halarsenatibacter silvermanii]
MILDRIVEQKKQEINRLRTTDASLAQVLRREEMTLIAELKKASPSAGVIEEEFEPTAQLKRYEKGGASAVSVLTDEEFFRGSSEILREVKRQTELPILRKDFIIDEIQVYESLILGADCLLLIGEILKRPQLIELLELAYEHDLEALVEVHTLETLAMILNTPAEIIGINNRNLEDFSVDLGTTEKLMKELARRGLEDDYLVVSESGISSREDIERLQELGVDGVLIGEALMKAEKPENKIAELLGDIEI